MDKIHFLDADGTFSLENPENYSGLYFPIAGTAGLKCSVTPNLGGDSKVDQETFLLEPVTIESLHNNRSTRNFWCRIAGKGCWSVTGVSAEQESRKFTPEQDASTLTAGFMWQTVKRVSETYRLEASVTSFVPAGEAVEIMYVRVRNRAETAQVIDPAAAVPIYGRSADNIRDHRNVTSMLHRVRTVKQGVLVKPTMSFDEKGHRENHRIYYVLGAAGDGGLPAAFYPTVDAFIGEGGSFLRPRAVYDAAAGTPSGRTVNGREAMGGIAFPQVTLQPGQSAAYIILLGVSETEADIERVFSAYDSEEKVRAALEETRTYWQNEVNVRCHTASSDFDNLLRWISFQPLLRRIYGCSFLPHHDYGRGGRGWRDLWQDCLSLLLMDPGSVGGMIKANFGGVRIDGTNATIIGAGDGSFIADRNGIARVWMDHALWPLMTTKLYIDQTGDLAILNVPAGYFKDPQAMRGTGIDALWDTEYGNRQRTEDGSYYAGSILEHLLIQHLTAFFEVGDHNIFRLRGADWNDALDMAADKGESVAFTCAYAGNLRQLAELLRRLEQKGGQKTAELLEELQTLLIDDPNVYEDVRLKKSILEQYVQRCRHSVTGRKVSVPLAELAGSLESMAGWLMEHIRRQEWIHGGQSTGWFNSYYDNHGRPVEGFRENGVRMMLTGQVFAVMSGTASDAQVREITRSADRCLYRREIGGYRLNTDFQELKFDMGRMFGFAYGEKENGAVFSHMTVMYANALYRRGFVREGYRALQTLADAALNFETSKIYPGIPEYFNSEGRGVYHYLTGAASWYMMTMLTEVFGAHGQWGDLAVCPKLVREQFDEAGTASVSFSFAGKQFQATFVNPAGKDYGEYRIAKAYLDGQTSRQLLRIPVSEGTAILRRQEILALPEKDNRMTIELI